MECLQLRSPPGPFHYLISEQAKSLVALQELQNEVGALLEFRDLVIETFPNLRSKMAPSTPASGTRRDWEPGVRVRRKLAAASGDSSRTKPQPSVQDSGFSTETSCGKDAHSSSASASATPAPPRPAPLEDELWALLDVIQRKGVRLRDEAEILRGDLDESARGRESPASSEAAEDSFARALSNGCPQCGEVRRLRRERDLLLARSAELEATAAAVARAAQIVSEPGTPDNAPPSPATPVGRLDGVLETPKRLPRIATPDSKKFAAILCESNPVELRRHLLTSTVQTEVLQEKLKRAAAQRIALLDRLERTREDNDDLKFQLEEKSIELEGTKAKMRQIEGKQKSPIETTTPSRTVRTECREHSSMRDMEPLAMPGDLSTEGEQRITETPKRERPSRIPLPGHSHKGAAPKPPTGRPSIGKESSSYRSRTSDSPGRPASAHSWRSAASNRSPSARLRAPSRDSLASKRDSYASVNTKKDSAPNSTTAKKVSSVPVRRPTRDVKEENKMCGKARRWLDDHG